MGQLEPAIEEFEKLCLDHPDGVDAKLFLKHFSAYCHAIDDIIDKSLDSHDVLLATFHLALQIYSSNFYRRYQDVLYPVVNLIHNTYADSVSMEKSGEKWQMDCADVLRSSAQEMTLVIIQILGGYAARRRLSIIIREYTYRIQHTEKLI